MLGVPPGRWPAERSEEAEQMFGELRRARPMKHVAGAFELDALETSEGCETLLLVRGMKPGSAPGDEEDRARDLLRELDEELGEERDR